VLAAGRAVTVGAIIQANFGGLLTVGGRPVPSAAARPAEQGSCVIVLATDAGLESRELELLAARAFAGMARTGSDFSGHSGDYALAIRTGAADADMRVAPEAAVPVKDLDLLFTAAIETTEEAILNSLFMAETTTGYQGHVSEAVPLDLVSGRPGSRSTSGS
jgi:D-aminopeptidase